MRKNVNTQNAMSYSEFLRRVADAIDKSAPKNVKDMNALVSSVTKSMEKSERENKAHDFIFKNRLLKVFVSLDAFPNYKNWDVFIGEKSFEIRCKTISEESNRTNGKQQEQCTYDYGNRLANIHLLFHAPPLIRTKALHLKAIRFAPLIPYEC